MVGSRRPLAGLGSRSELSDIKALLVLLGWLAVFCWIAVKLVETNHMVILTAFIVVMLLVALWTTRRR